MLGRTNWFTDLVRVGMTARCRFRVIIVLAVIAAASTLAGCTSRPVPAAYRHTQHAQHSDVTQPPQHATVSVCASAGVAAGGGCPMLANPGYADCLRAFTGGRVLGWEPTTVAHVRSYQYGGPIAHRPLQHAFPGTAGSRHAAWCLVRTGPDTASLWGALASGRRQHALTISGPGAANYRGLMTAPPQVP
jgi:hypothetical protein